MELFKSTDNHERVFTRLTISPTISGGGWPKLSICENKTNSNASPFPIKLNNHQLMLLWTRTPKCTSIAGTTSFHETKHCGYHFWLLLKPRACDHCIFFKLGMGNLKWQQIWQNHNNSIKRSKLSLCSSSNIIESVPGNNYCLLLSFFFTLRHNHSE